MEAQGVHHKLLSHYQYRKEKDRDHSRCTRFTNAALDPVDGVLVCRLEIVNYSHLPVSELISSKPGACCQMHHWFMDEAVKKRQQLLYCEDCN
eukprot:3650176-Ditylum_brightwellii.AAC.1